MSRSTLPPLPGEPPVKVVFETSDPGADAQQLLMANQGALGQFQSKARQSRELSGNPIATMQGTLPGGGRVRSSYNNGQETLYVKLDPVRPGEESNPQVTPPLPPPPPFLAIDVIFNNALFDVGMIYSYATTTVSGTPDAPPGTPADEQPNFTQIATYPAPDHSDFLDTDFQTGGPFSVMFDNIPALGDSWTTGGIVATFPDPYDQIVAANLASGFHAHVASGAAGQFIAVYEFQNGRHTGGFGGGSSTQYVYARELWQRSAPPGGTAPARRNFFDHREYYDLLTVVGVRADPDGKPYEADSLGHTTDKRLTPLVLGAAQIVTRKVTYAAGTSEGMLGHCFLAQPQQPPTPGVDPEEMTFDVYVEAMNVRQRNTIPTARPGSVFAVDDSSMIYNNQPNVKWRLNVRELLNGQKLVQVNLAAEGRSHKFQSSLGAPPGPSPTTEVSSTILPTAREQSWIFAAEANWEDTHPDGPPADPHAKDSSDKPSMGNLLWLMEDELGGMIITSVDGPSPLPRAVPDHPVWTQGIDAMKKIATIKWTPSKDGIKPGTVTVIIL